MPINDFAHITTGKLPVGANLQLVGIDIVDAITTLQVLTEISESTTQDGNFVTITLQGGHQTINTLGDRQLFGYLLHHAHIESLEQTDAAGKTLLKVDFTTHGAFGDGTYLGTNTVALSQFVDTLGLNQC